MLTSWYFNMAKTHMLQAPVCTSSRCMYFHMVPMNCCLNSTFGKLCVEWNGSQMIWSGFVCSPKLFLKLYIFFWAWSQSVKGTMRAIFVRSAYIKNPKTSAWPRRIKPFDELGLVFESKHKARTHSSLLLNSIREVLLNVSCSPETWNGIWHEGWRKEREREAEQWLNGFLMLMHFEVPLVVIFPST